MWEINFIKYTVNDVGEVFVTQFGIGGKKCYLQYELIVQVSLETVKNVQFDDYNTRMVLE